MIHYKIIILFVHFNAYKLKVLGQFEHKKLHTKIGEFYPFLLVIHC